jgi:hypothetical protein
MKKLLLGMLIVALSVSACGPSATNAPSTQPTVAPATQAAPQATATSAPPPATATTAPSATATKVPQPSAPTGNPFDLILNAHRAQMSAKTWRTRTTQTDSDGKTSTTLFEYVAPDRMHLATSTGNETIAIKGVGTYQKPAGGQWLKSPIDMSDLMFSFLDPKAFDEYKDTIVTTDVKFVGPDLIDTKPMFVYQYSSIVKGTLTGTGDLKGTTKLWVGVVDGLPYKTESDQDSAVKPGTKTHTVVIYDYDPNIKIDPPVK